VSASEKRSFFLYLFVLIVCAVSVSFGQSGFALCAVILAFFGLFRLAYLFEQHLKNFSHFLSLPSKILFGLSEKEEEHKKNILKTLQRKDIITFFGIGFLYVLWIIFCGLHVISQEEISNIFQKDIPNIPTFSYLNTYETVQGVVWIGIVALIIFSSISFSQSKFFLKIGMIIMMPIFLLLLCYVLWKADFIFSLPPLYTALMQGIGAGKADLLFSHQGDIFLYLPTGLFMRYIEVGLIGLMLFFAIFLIPAFYFLKNIVSASSTDFYFLSGLGVILCLFAVDCFLISPELILPLQMIGFSIVGMAWGRKRAGKDAQNSLTKI